MLVPLSKTKASKAPMNWYYAVEGRSHGPVSQEDLFRLAKEGTVETDTLIWHPGLEEWDPVWKLLPQAMNHLNNKSAMSEPAKGDTERIPLGDPPKGETARIPLSEQEKMGRVSESMFKRFFVRLKKP
jgi:hypothetical protein